jgi:hypothetical protein
VPERATRSSAGSEKSAEVVVAGAEEGRRYVVDVDLEKFFDRVNHDVLMGRLEQRIADRRVLGLIRRYLEAGVLANGVVIERYEGTPDLDARRVAANGRRWWRNSAMAIHLALPNALFDKLGVPRLAT